MNNDYEKYGQIPCKVSKQKKEKLSCYVEG